MDRRYIYIYIYFFLLGYMYEMLFEKKRQGPLWGSLEHDMQILFFDSGMHFMNVSERSNGHLGKELWGKM